MSWRPPACNDGNEPRNARWHAAYTLLALGSLLFHGYSVYVHLQRDKENKHAPK